MKPTTQSPELFTAEEVTMDSPRLTWMKEHGLTCWHTPTEGLEESPETGEPLKPWTCCTLQELERLSWYACGTGDTEEEACMEWARKHHQPLWNQEGALPSVCRDPLFE